MDLKVDSRLDMVETWATRKDSYWAKGEDMEVRTEERETESGGSVADPQVDAGIGTVAGK